VTSPHTSFNKRTQKRRRQNDLTDTLLLYDFNYIYHICVRSLCVRTALNRYCYMMHSEGVSLTFIYVYVCMHIFSINQSITTTLFQVTVKNKLTWFTTFIIKKKKRKRVFGKIRSVCVCVCVYLILPSSSPPHITITNHQLMYILRHNVCILYIYACIQIKRDSARDHGF
jgi:hypothetical protein